MVAKSIDIHDPKLDLPELISQVQEGAEIVFVEGDVPLARLIAMSQLQDRGLRKADLHPDSIWTSDDFDDPLPDEFWLGEDA